MQGNLSFEHVFFHYTPDKPVLHDITFHAAQGQKIALVGSTGAGKTSITSLINRFFDLSGGAITYDGIDIKNERVYCKNAATVPKSKRPRIAMILPNIAVTA